MEEPLLLQLHKLSDSIPEEGPLSNVLQTLWKTRRTGLQPQDKSTIQSLLNLPPSQPLDLVLACLRLLIRKCVNQNLVGEELVKLLPPGLSADLQKILVHILQKHQTQWKNEASTEQTAWHRPNNSHVKYGIPSSAPLSTTEIPPSMWPRQNEPLAGINHSDSTSATPVVANTSVPFVPPPLLQRVDGFDNLATLPRLKSMTWTMNNQKSRPAERVSAFSLKLNDYAESPSGEREVKFQLNKDTVEAMLTSMTYISNQLSNTGGASSGRLQKRPRV